MRITFILPGFVSVPMGGVKVIHEYANRLSKRGHKVTLVYPLQPNMSFQYRLKKFLASQFDRLMGNKQELYYTPEPDVAVSVIKSISPKYIPDGDAVIAAGWQTAQPVAELPATCGRKFYFLQHFETYFRSRRQVLKTFQLPLIKIAIAQWIINELKRIGQNAEGPVANAINPDEFFIESEATERNIDVIAVYHYMQVKGPKVLIDTLKNIKKAKNINVTILSSRKPVHRFPSWVNVIVQPSVKELRKLYNSARVFLHTSHSEGWGLPVMEAMACGCAVVAAGNKGVREYLKHNENALLAPPGDSTALADCVQTLLENKQQRAVLSKNALATLNRFSWEQSITKFDSILQKNIFQRSKNEY